MAKKSICIVIILAIMIGVVGCKKKEEPYPYGKYTRQEVLDLFNQNRDLFNELVGAILADTYFLENGNVHHDEKTFVMPNQYKYMELFNERSQNAIRRILEFKPYIVQYNFIRDIIEITFIGDGVVDEGFTFEYLVDQSDLREIEDYIRYREQNYYVEQLTGGWIFSANVLE